MSAIENIKIFIGTEAGNEKAEKALHYSIIQNSSGPVEIYWMSDKYKDSVWDGWNKGREHRDQNSGVGWKTNFSVFRWTIPELCGFKGKAIYLDVDQIILKDIRKMWELPMNNAAVLAIKPERTDVMLIDCEKFNNELWPKIESMKPSGKHQKHYRTIVQEKLGIGQLDLIYNCLDGKKFDKDKTRLLHYTKMSTQPWKPFPQTIQYEEHKNKQVEELWHSYYEESLRFENRFNYKLGSPNNFFDLKTRYELIVNSAAKYIKHE
jgi:lipopolysaccharide biosynthesis glycosyltransferase